VLWINLAIACRTQSEEKEIREVKKRKPEEKKATKIPEEEDMILVKYFLFVASCYMQLIGITLRISVVFP